MDQDLIRVLEKISNTLEESTATLNRIADHYDGVVPVMTRNQKRVEEAHNEVEDNRSPLDWGEYLNPKKIFGEPETNN